MATINYNNILLIINCDKNAIYYQIESKFGVQYNEVCFDICNV